MKNCLRKTLSLLLCLTLCISTALPAFAVGENNTLGVTFEAVLDQDIISVSDTDQEVKMTIKAIPGATFDGMGMTLTWSDGLQLTAVAGGAAVEANNAFTAAMYNTGNGKVTWGTSDMEVISDVTEMLVATFKIPANTPAGTYTLGANNIELTSDYAGTTWESSASVSATLTIEDASTPTTGYTATMTTSAANNEVVSGSSINVNVAVSHSSDAAFNAGEIKLTYDSTKLTPNTTSLDAMVTAGTLSGYNIANGVLTIEDFGVDKSMPYTYNIPFTAAEVSNETTDTVTLTRAAFIHKDNASSSDLIEATKSPKSLTVTIKVAMVNVTLTNSADSTDTTTVQTQKGQDYTFAPTDTANYTYSNVTATVDGSSVTVTDNDNGTFTIAADDVTGDIALTYTKTAKSYSVTYEGAGVGDLTTKPETATYGQNLTVTLPDDIAPGTSVGYNYGISAKIGETSVGTYEESTRTLTIAGTDITGDITITVTKQEVSATQVTITVAGDSGLTIEGVTGNTITVEKGTSVTLVLTEEVGYVYKVVDSNNNEVTFTEGKYTFTASVTETYTVTKTLDVSTVQVTEYVKVDSYIIYLVTYDGTLAEGKVPTYDGNVMFWSDSYDAYCWLVIDSTLTVDTAKTMISAQTGTVTKVDYGMDINGTNVTDAADAQLVWNMYNAMYSDFSDVSMDKFLAADQNAASTETANWGLNVQDAQVIITAILEGNATT